MNDTLSQALQAEDQDERRTFADVPHGRFNAGVEIFGRALLAKSKELGTRVDPADVIYAFRSSTEYSRTLAEYAIELAERDAVRECSALGQVSVYSPRCTTETMAIELRRKVDYYYSPVLLEEAEMGVRRKDKEHWYAIYHTGCSLFEQIALLGNALDRWERPYFNRKFYNALRDAGGVLQSDNQPSWLMWRYPPGMYLVRLDPIQITGWSRVGESVLAEGNAYPLSSLAPLPVMTELLLNAQERQSRLGKGTTPMVNLPRHYAVPLPDSKQFALLSAKADGAARGIRVLLADDPRDGAVYTLG